MGRRAWVGPQAMALLLLLLAVMAPLPLLPLPLVVLVVVTRPWRAWAGFRPAARSSRPGPASERARGRVTAG